MNFSRLLAAPLATAALLAAPAAPAMENGHAGHDHATAAGSLGEHGEARIVKGAQVVELTITKSGFEPSSVTVKRGTPVKLVVTRKTERTCVTEIVIKSLGVNRPLPLDKPVTVELTPKKPGEYRYACAMDMVAGVLKVE